MAIKNVTRLPDRDNKANLSDLTMEDRQSTRGVIDLEEIKCGKLASKKGKHFMEDEESKM